MALTPALAIFPGLIVPLKGGVKKAFGWIAEYIFHTKVIQGSDVTPPVTPPVDTGANDLRHIGISLAYLSASALVIWIKQRLEKSGGSQNPTPGPKVVAEESPETSNGSQAPAATPQNIASTSSSNNGPVLQQDAQAETTGGGGDRRQVTGKPNIYTLSGIHANQFAAFNSGDVTFNNTGEPNNKPEVQKGEPEDSDSDDN